MTSRITFITSQVCLERKCHLCDIQLRTECLLSQLRKLLRSLKRNLDSPSISSSGSLTADQLQQRAWGRWDTPVHACVTGHDARIVSIAFCHQTHTGGCLGQSIVCAHIASLPTCMHLIPLGPSRYPLVRGGCGGQGPAPGPQAAVRH